MKNIDCGFFRISISSEAVLNFWQFIWFIQSLVLSHLVVFFSCPLFFSGGQNTKRDNNNFKKGGRKTNYSCWLRQTSPKPQVSCKQQRRLCSTGRNQFIFRPAGILTNRRVPAPRVPVGSRGEVLNKGGSPSKLCWQSSTHPTQLIPQEGGLTQTGRERERARDLQQHSIDHRVHQQLIHNSLALMLPFSIEFGLHPRNIWGFFKMCSPELQEALS